MSFEGHVNSRICIKTNLFHSSYKYYKSKSLSSVMPFKNLNGMILYTRLDS